MLTERVNKKHCEIEGEEKPSISVIWRIKKNRTKKKQRKEQISKTPQHMETGSDKEEVLTGFPCGGCCLSTGLRMEVCACVNHMDVYICVLCAYKCVSVKLTGLLRKGPLLQRWQTSSSLSVCWVGDDGYLNRRAYASSSQGGGAVMEGSAASF